MILSSAVRNESRAVVVVISLLKVTVGLVTAREFGSIDAGDRRPFCGAAGDRRDRPDRRHRDLVQIVSFEGGGDLLADFLDVLLFRANAELLAHVPGLGFPLQVSRSSDRLGNFVFEQLADLFDLLRFGELERDHRAAGEVDVVVVVAADREADESADDDDGRGAPARISACR